MRAEIATWSWPLEKNYACKDHDPSPYEILVSGLVYYLSNNDGIHCHYSVSTKNCILWSLRNIYWSLINRQYHIKFRGFGLNSSHEWRGFEFVCQKLSSLGGVAICIWFGQCNSTLELEDVDNSFCASYLTSHVLHCISLPSHFFKARL